MGKVHLAYFINVFILRLASRLPLSFLYALSTGVYALLYYVFRYRRRVCRNNLHNAFPTLGANELQNIEKKYYRYLVDIFVETIKAYGISKKELYARVEHENYQVLEQYLANKQSVVILTCHTGNLEWLLFSTQLRLGHYIDPVYKPLHSKFFDRFIFQVRSRFGATPIPYKNIAQDLRRRKDILRCIALPIDHAPRRREQVYEVDFLNQSTPFFSSIERILRATQLPVVMVTIRRKSRGHYIARADELGQPPFDKSVQGEITQRYAGILEKHIQAHPEAWLWSHRRWKDRSKKRDT